MSTDKFDILSDQTKVRSQTWSDLKQIAMLPGFKTTASYSTLPEEDQDLLNRLIDAQSAQGDMLELVMAPSEA